MDSAEQIYQIGTIWADCIDLEQFKKSYEAKYAKQESKAADNVPEKVDLTPDANVSEGFEMCD